MSAPPPLRHHAPIRYFRLRNPVEFIVVAAAAPSSSCNGRAMPRPATAPPRRACRPQARSAALPPSLVSTHTASHPSGALPPNCHAQVKQKHCYEKGHSHPLRVHDKGETGPQELIRPHKNLHLLWRARGNFVFRFMMYEIAPFFCHCL